MTDILNTDTYKINYRNKANGIDLLGEIKDDVITACFFDPQYRGVLDKLGYGNEGETRCTERSELSQMDNDMICAFIKEISRVLKPSGYLFLWVDKFHLCEGITPWLEDTQLQIVDMIVWDKSKIGMGYRTRKKSEYLIVVQKLPIKAKETWKDHSIPDVWGEKVLKNHPHSKPIQLQKQLIECVSEPNDFILDPASGGYSVLTACRYCGRNFIGGDIEYGEEEFTEQDIGEKTHQIKFDWLSNL